MTILVKLSVKDILVAELSPRVWEPGHPPLTPSLWPRCEHHLVGVPPDEKISSGRQRRELTHRWIGRTPGIYRHLPARGMCYLLSGPLSIKDGYCVYVGRSSVGGGIEPTEVCKLLKGFRNVAQVCTIPISSASILIYRIRMVTFHDQSCFDDERGQGRDMYTPKDAGELRSALYTPQQHNTQTNHF